MESLVNLLAGRIYYLSIKMIVSSSKYFHLNYIIILISVQQELWMGQKRAISHKTNFLMYDQHSDIKNKGGGEGGKVIVR